MEKNKDVLITIVSFCFGAILAVLLLEWPLMTILTCMLYAVVAPDRADNA